MPDAQKSIPLKLPDPVVDADDPWGDDRLGRKDIADRLTNLIADQKAPLTISLHGGWGTGKTFMLERWQKTLENDGYKAIYFNAWQDDFCDDPLLAVIGQLADYFKDHSLNAIARKAGEIAIPLIKATVIGTVKSYTGLTLPTGQAEKDSKPFLDKYLELKDTRNDLKRQLAKLAEQVAKETEHPLVFIIDELDRCRPTFAIELLERVKHIFDIPNTVFVFGVNRDELCQTLSSVYGNIQTDVYFRRFFDFEFSLSGSDSQEFAKHLIDKFDIARRQNHIEASGKHAQIIPKLWSALGLSLRDIKYGIQLLALLVRNASLNEPTYPYRFAAFIAMKFKRPEFYHSLAEGNFRTREIMDYIDDEVRSEQVDRDVRVYLDQLEGFLYGADVPNKSVAIAELERAAELKRTSDNSAQTDFQIISRRAQKAEEPQLDYMIRVAKVIKHDPYTIHDRDPFAFRKLVELIDTYQTHLRQ